MKLSVNVKQLIALLAIAFKRRRKVLIKGQPGIGKTDIVKHACKIAGALVIFMHPAISDPTDFKGMPAITNEGTEAHFLPFGDLMALISADKLTVCFIDDIGQAPQGVQAALMQLIQERRVNGHRISEHVVFCGATNDTSHRSGVSGILETVKSRFDTIVELVPDVDDWCSWACGVGNMPPELIGFIRFRPDLLNDFKPTRELTNSPSPRTVAAVGEWVNDGITDLPTLAGAAGAGFASEFIGFLKLYRSLPSIDQILLDPSGATVPKEPAALYAVGAALIRKFTPKSARAVFTYAVRMPKENEVVVVLDGLRTNDELRHTPEFTQWAIRNGGVLS